MMVASDDILRRQAILDTVRALGFNFHFITGFYRRFFQRLSGHKSVRPGPLGRHIRQSVSTHR